jgi:hypothetical protein
MASENTLARGSLPICRALVKPICCDLIGTSVRRSTSLKLPLGSLQRGSVMNGKSRARVLLALLQHGWGRRRDVGSKIWRQVVASTAISGFHSAMRTMTRASTSACTAHCESNRLTNCK